MILRPYQIKAIEMARASFNRGNKRIALCLATGSGKSPIAREIIKLFRDKNPNGKIGYFTFRTVLINQMKETLAGLDVEIGTIQKHGKFETELYDLVIIDEVHYASDSKLQNNIKSKYILGLTATPIDAYGNALEFDEIIDVIQLVDLIDLGYASPVKVLSTSSVDTSNLKTIAGDFSQKQAYDLMSKSQIKKDIVDIYKKYALGLKTIIYGVNIKHCEDLKEEFINAGIHCDSLHSKKKDTEKSIKDFKDGKINLIINCDILVTGFDAPDIYCLMLASPTKSLIKSTQIYGRATRLNPNDKNKVALIIDCAEVIKNTQHPLQRFDFTKTKQDNAKICKCGLKMKLSDRKIEVLNEFEYIVRSDYKCQCGLSETVENLKLINIEQCEGCKERFVSSGGLVLTKYDNGLCFDLECKHCGFKKPFRELKYSNDELQEITLNEALSGDKWENVKTILRAECKKCGYKWQYSDRILEHLQMKAFTPIEAIDKIKMIMKNGQKISRLMYV